MPALNVTSRPLTELERFVVSELHGVSDQVATLEKLKALIRRLARGTAPEDEKLRDEATAFVGEAE